MIYGSFVTLEMTFCVMGYSNQHSILCCVMPIFANVVGPLDTEKLHTMHGTHTTH